MTNARDYQRLEEQGIDLLELLGGDRALHSEEFARIVNELGSVGDELYADLLQLLSHRRYSDQDARRIWRGILKHKRRLEKKLGRDPGIRVAALDYLTNVRSIISRPRLIDRGDFEQLISHVHVDELTGLFNRRHFKAVYHQELRRARRYSKSLTVMILDVDNFKVVNDTHGHAVGDRVLIRLAELLREVCRETDTIGRFGGDEIVVLLPEAKKSDAFVLAERIRRAARESELYADAERTERVRFSLSIGLATYPDDSQEAAELLELADRALYASKRRGRDVVSLYEPDSEPTRRRREGTG